ncbi:hypothetical protein B0T10DRAFT_553562 [Thelonectria olida]|uniref:C2H2-type domain-containing protein n=1 Tax=Thelonectria olida TaxID=1576542 RepID=A0A9P9AK19_9HYPO|nr:hypothetical protein B0T10DRAFT_553562 [Thelonectria olida]
MPRRSPCGFKSAVVLDPAHAASLQSHYGSRLFRCTYAFYEHSYRGFETESDRDAHIKNHGKPWKCSIPNCDFSTIDFSSKARRDKHWLKAHLPVPSQLEAGLNDFKNLDVAEAQPVVFDHDGARRLLSAPGGRKLKAEVIASARCLAAKEGSLAMTQLLAAADETYTPQIIVISAVQSEDVDFAKWPISKAQPEDCAKIMKIRLGIEALGMTADANARQRHLDVWHPYRSVKIGRQSGRLCGQTAPVSSCIWIQDVDRLMVCAEGRYERERANMGCYIGLLD